MIGLSSFLRLPGEPFLLTPHSWLSGARPSYEAVFWAGLGWGGKKQGETSHFLLNSLCGLWGAGQCAQAADTRQKKGMCRAGVEGSGSQDPDHSPTHLCSSPDFLGRSVGLWSELSSGCPMGRESSLGYSTAHMLFVSGDGSVPHSGQVFEASGSWKIQSTFQEQSDDSLITQHRAFSCDHSFLGKR